MRVFGTLCALVAGLQLVHATIPADASAGVKGKEPTSKFSSSVSNVLGYSWTPHEVNFESIVNGLQPDDDDFNTRGLPRDRRTRRLDGRRRRTGSRDGINDQDEGDVEEDLDNLEEDLEDLEEDLEDQEADLDDEAFEDVDGETEQNDYHAGFTSTEICRRFDGIGRFIEELADLADRVTPVNYRSRRPRPDRYNIQTRGALFKLVQGLFMLSDLITELRRGLRVTTANFSDRQESLIEDCFSYFYVEQLIRLLDTINDFDVRFRLTDNTAFITLLHDESFMRLSIEERLERLAGLLQIDSGTANQIAAELFALAQPAPGNDVDNDGIDDSVDDNITVGNNTNPNPTPSGPSRGPTPFVFIYYAILDLCSINDAVVDVLISKIRRERVRNLIEDAVGPAFGSRPAATSGQINNYCDAIIDWASELAPTANEFEDPRNPNTPGDRLGNTGLDDNA